MQQFEIALKKHHHKTYINATSRDDAIFKYVERNNHVSQRKISFEDVEHCVASNKKKYNEIVKNHIADAKYRVNVEIDDVPGLLERYKKDYDLEVSPYFQREKCWTDEQKQAYIEHLLRNGMSGRDFYFNFPNWMSFKPYKGTARNMMVCVDGQQRLDAIMSFVENKITVFDGHFYEDFMHLDSSSSWLNIHINNFTDEKDILKWYIDLNDTGVAHTREELDRVKSLMEKA